MSPLISLPMQSDVRDVPVDELTQLELQIARRADELMRNRDRLGTQDPWMQAEREAIRQLLDRTMLLTS